MTEQSAATRRAFWVDPENDPRAKGEQPVGETTTLRQYLEGQTDLAHLYFTEEDPDLDFDGAVGTDDCVPEAWESWRREVAHAREVYAATTTSVTTSSRVSRGRRAESSCT